MRSRLFLRVSMLLLGSLVATASAEGAVPWLVEDLSMASSERSQIIESRAAGDVNLYHPDQYRSGPPLVYLSVGQRTWLSQGQTMENFAGLDGFPNVLSELTWQSVDSTVVEFNVDTVVCDKIVVSADVGFGEVVDGRLLDHDYLWDNRQATWSSSFSPASGDDLFYFNLDLGYRVMSSWDECGEIERYLDLFVGWQHWRESYTAVGGSGVDAMTGVFLLPDIPVITHDFQWSSLRLGARGHFKISRRLSLRPRLVLVPYTNCQFEDTHYLRDDKSQPGWVVDVDGGWGVMFDQTLAYNVWQGLFIELGYQIYHINSGSGKMEVRNVSPPDVDVPFNEAVMTRHGIILVVRYEF